MHDSRTLAPEVEQINVGASDEETPSTPAPSEPPPKPVPLGTYVPPELKRAFKARCVELDIDMKDAITEAMADWLTKSSESEQASYPAIEHGN